MSRVLAVVVGLTVAVATLGVMVSESATAGDATSTTEAAPETVAAERGPLSTTVSGVGILTYRARPDGLPYPVTNRSSGTYTHLPVGGDVVECGEAMYHVDDRPVLLLCGALPAYRSLQSGNVGEDVRQLNANLHQLGYGTDVVPGGDTFTADTATALAALQESAGIPVTATLDVGDVVFLPSAVRITNVAGVLSGNADPGAQVLTATSNTPVVLLELDSSQQQSVHAGDQARITVPGNTSLTGRVDRLGRIAKVATSSDEPARATAGAYIDLDDPGAVGSVDKATVQVQITTDGLDDALSVPVVAIVGHAGGGFAVEIVRHDGSHELVPVELGMFDGSAGRVEIAGEIREGDRVLVPSQ